MTNYMITAVDTSIDRRDANLAVWIFESESIAKEYLKRIRMNNDFINVGLKEVNVARFIK